MFYFKKVYLTPIEKVELGDALRKFSAKRPTILDFQSSAIGVADDKFFLGYIGKNDLKFTRIRAGFDRYRPGFDRYLPKLIISLPNDPESLYYQIRLSVFSIFAFCALTTGVVFVAVSMFTSDNTIYDLLYISGFLIAFLLFALLELKLVQSKIARVVSSYKLTKIKEKL